MIAILRQKQTKTLNTSGASTTLVWPSDTQSGSLIVLAFGIDTTTAIMTISSITDTQSNTYTKIYATNSAGIGHGELWYAAGIRGGTTPTITVNFSSSSSSDVSMVAQEYSGVSPITPLDKNASVAGSSTAPSSGATVATTKSYELVIGAASSDNGTGQTYTAGSGYSNLLSVATTGTDVGIESKIVSSVGTQTGSFTLGTSSAWVAGVATFRLLSPEAFAANRGLRPHPFSPGLAR